MTKREDVCEIFDFVNVRVRHSYLNEQEMILHEGSYIRHRHKFTTKNRGGGVREMMIKTTLKMCLRSKRSFFARLPSQKIQFFQKSQIHHQKKSFYQFLKFFYSRSINQRNETQCS